jgi:hypothetical protein
MSTTEFPTPGSGAGINSQIELDRATPMVLRNSRILCWVTMFGSIVAAFFVVCMALMVFSILSSSGGISTGNVISACQWGFGALAFGYMSPWLWKMGRNMAGYQILLDSRGATFNLGTKKNPSDLFLPWDQITALKYTRSGNIQQYFVQARDGSEARFSTYTFFRAGKFTRLIGDRTGLAIERV